MPFVRRTESVLLSRCARLLAEAGGGLAQGHHLLAQAADQLQHLLIHAPQAASSQRRWAFDGSISIADLVYLWAL